MKNFEVFASEQTFYKVRVRAKSEEEARDKILSGDIELGDPEDSDGFEIEKVVEINKNGFPV